MSHFDDLKYDFLQRKRYVIHDEHRSRLSDQTLKEIEHHEPIEFYPREKIIELSKNGAIQSELNRHIESLLELRKKHPDGSNEECICMDFITELISKLDLEDFRKLKVEGLLDI